VPRPYDGHDVGAGQVRPKKYINRTKWGGRRDFNSLGTGSQPAASITSASATIGARGTSRTCLSGFSNQRLDRNGLPGRIWWRSGESNSGFLVAGQVCCHYHYTPMNWSRRLESNQLMRAYQTRARPVSIAEWRPVRESNPLRDVTKVAHRRQCLPALERVTGFEPVSTAWQAVILPLDDTRKNGASSESRTRVSGLEDQGTSRYTIPAWSRGRDLHPPRMAYETMLELPPVHPARNCVQLSKSLVGAAGFEPAYLLRPKQAASHLPTPRRPDTSSSDRESFTA
jgi:hypothetical protein